MTKIYTDKALLLLLFYILTIAFAIIGLKSLIISLTPENGFISIDGQYVGRDFLPFYAAGKQALAGNIKSLYTPLGAYQATQAVVPYFAEDKISHLAWPYPPHFLLFMLPFATLPYFHALVTWLSISMFLPSVLLWWFCKVRSYLFFAAIFNFNVLVCLIMGQNALILASIVGIGILSLTKFPKLSGLLFAIASIKPHFILLIPLVLLLGKYWQALIYTIISTFFLILLTSLLLGFDIWLLAMEHFHAVSTAHLSSGLWILSIYSTYHLLLELGVSETYAWAGHFTIATLALYGIQNIWRKNHKLTIKWLAFSITALLISPYSFAYDAPWILLPTMAWVYERINRKIQTPAIVFALAAIQIFAFPIFSINSSLSVLIIISALFLLFFLAKTENIGLPSKNA